MFYVLLSFLFVFMGMGSKAIVKGRNSEIALSIFNLSLAGGYHPSTILCRDER